MSMSQRARVLLPQGFPPDAPATPSVHAMRDEFIHTGDALVRCVCVLLKLVFRIT
jgi:hypothetical protein